MKELSIEEKAKAYDEAIKKAETLYKAAEPMSGCNVIIETLFPELKESEDERIRRELIKVFSNREKYLIDQSFVDITVSEVLAWLEKVGNIIKEWGDLKVCYIQDDLQEMVELKQKPAWSKEDELKRSTLVDVVKKQQGSAIFEGLLPDELIDWLKSLKGRVQPQPKQEWNEKDKGLRDLALWCVKQEEASYDGELFSQQNFVDAKYWLKSLRPQNTWKPSDEQMKCLECTIALPPDGYGWVSTIESLYNDLKKL